MLSFVTKDSATLRSLDFSLAVSLLFRVPPLSGVLMFLTNI
jgi:hypothetical protein